MNPLQSSQSKKNLTKYLMEGFIFESQRILSLLGKTSQQDFFASQEFS